MSVDIVERLRFWSETRNNQPTSWNIDCAQAADEIERLRNALRAIADNKNDEPYAADFARDILGGKDER